MMVPVLEFPLLWRNTMSVATLIRENIDQAVVVLTFSLSTWEAEGVSSLLVQGQPDLQELVIGQTPKLQWNLVLKKNNKEKHLFEVVLRVQSFSPFSSW